MEARSIEPAYINAYLIHYEGNQPRYLLLHRCSEYLTNTWQMISGGIHEGEKAYEAALREVFEETGLTPDRFYHADTIESFYEPFLDKILFVPVFVGFINQFDNVKLSPTEHDDYVWLPYEQAIDLLEFHEQKRIITHIHHYLVLKEPNPILSIRQEISTDGQLIIKNGRPDRTSKRKKPEVAFR